MGRLALYSAFANNGEARDIRLRSLPEHVLSHVLNRKEKQQPPEAPEAPSTKEFGRSADRPAVNPARILVESSLERLRRHHLCALLRCTAWNCACMLVPRRFFELAQRL